MKRHIPSGMVFDEVIACAFEEDIEDVCKYEDAKHWYKVGFMASGEGWNGEYPFSDKSNDPETDSRWVAKRDAAMQKGTEK